MGMIQSVPMLFFRCRGLIRCFFVMMVRPIGCHHDGAVGEGRGVRARGQAGRGGATEGEREGGRSGEMKRRSRLEAYCKI